MEKFKIPSLEEFAKINPPTDEIFPYQQQILNSLKVPTDKLGTSLERQGQSAVSISVKHNKIDYSIIDDIMFKEENDIKKSIFRPDTVIIDDPLCNKDIVSIPYTVSIDARLNTDGILDALADFAKNNASRENYADCIFATKKAISTMSEMAYIREETEAVYARFAGIEVREYNPTIPNNTIADYQVNFIERNGRPPKIIILKDTTS